jgi:carbonic anhydrase
MSPSRSLSAFLFAATVVALAAPWSAAGADSSNIGGPPRGAAQAHVHVSAPGSDQPKAAPGAGPAAAAAAHGAAHGPARASGSQEPSGAELWNRLCEGNFRFVASAPLRRTYHDRRAELAQSQHPPVMVLTCADSRVSPELVFDQTLGDLFVVRAAGNVADAFAVASLEYAAEHLGCRLLVVMGHERCGAVKAAASGDAMPTPSLRALVERIRPALEQVPPHQRGSEHLLDLQIAENVRQSSLDLLEASPLLVERVAAGELSVVRCVYDLDSGYARRID